MPHHQHQHIEDGDGDRGGQRTQTHQTDGPAQQRDSGFEITAGIGPDAETDMAGIAQRQQEKHPATEARHIAIRGRDPVALHHHERDQRPYRHQVADIEDDFHPHARFF